MPRKLMTYINDFELTIMFVNSTFIVVTSKDILMNTGIFQQKDFYFVP